ncbi:MAG: hypothetical protein EPO24_06060 [Bacteroidetes bacterium]|nr:MAG: hypothetical protein EPO24_06060 [Bacteroidota bacterium]
MPQVAEELKITYRDIPSLGESNKPMELFDGDLIMDALPTPFHQYIQANLIYLLKRFLNKNKIGKVFGAVDVFISEFTVYSQMSAFS